MALKLGMFGDTINFNPIGDNSPIGLFMLPIKT